MAELRLSANRGGTPGGITIANGSTLTGYYLLDGINWGNYAAELVYSTRKDGTSTATDYNLPPRQVDVPIRVLGASWAATNASVIALGKEVEACKRSGGVLRFKSNNATYPVYLAVRGAMLVLPSLVSNRTEMHYRTDGVLSLVTDPAATGDKMSFRDYFDTDTSTDYTQDAGAWTISSGVVSYASNGLKRVRHTARGYNYTDVQVTMKVTAGSTVASADWAVMARCQGTADTALLARVVGSATNQIQFAKVTAGVVVVLASAAFVPAVSTNYWIRLRLEGQTGTAEVFTSEPKPLDAASASASALMLAVDQQTFVSGPCGIRSTLVAFATERFDDFDVRAYAYRTTSPDVMRLTGIPGDLPAAITSALTVPAALATQAVFGGFFWAERQKQINLCWNGNFETTIAGLTVGWFNTAVAGVISAAGTSGPTRNATLGKFGGACVEFATTAVSSQGLNFPMPRRFKKNRSYVAVGWMQSAAGVGSSDLLLGVNGDLSTGTAAALSSAWKLYACVWNPSADRDVAYLAPRHVAASAETVRVDGLGVFETTSQTLASPITSTSQTTMTLTAAPAEGNPAAPCVFLLDSYTATPELVRGTAVAADGVTWTIERGWDGSTAATHGGLSQACALPGYWFDATSDGVHGSMLDVFGVANPYTAGAGLTTMSADATQRSGFKILGGSANTQFQWSVLLDPSTMVPPDFSGDELLVEVWLRYLMVAAAPSPRLTLYTRGEDGTVSPIRYDLENGSGGLAVLSPTGSSRRFARVGVIPIRYSDAQQRRRIQVGLFYDITASGTAVSFDYLQLVPVGQRASSPTGRLNDSSYPSFLPITSTQQTRRVMSDLSSEAGLARETLVIGNLNPSGGIIGAPVLFGAPNSDVMVKLSNLVPNGGVAADSDESLSIAADATIAVSFNPTPRFLTLR